MVTQDYGLKNLCLKDLCLPDFENFFVVHLESDNHRRSILC